MSAKSLSLAACEAWEETLSWVFNQKREFSGGSIQKYDSWDFSPKPSEVGVSWVLLPCALYTPGAQHHYELRNEVVHPILLKKGDLGLLKGCLDLRARALQPDQELGISTNITVAWENGVVELQDLQIYDGAPHLTSIPKNVYEKFNILDTGKSYHFYAKGIAKFCDIEGVVDYAWMVFKETGAGYIRVTNNKKSFIKKASLAKLLVTSSAKPSDDPFLF